MTTNPEDLVLRKCPNALGQSIIGTLEEKHHYWAEQSEYATISVELEGE
jgi:hypothetical protein